MAKKELPTLKDVSRIPEELIPVVNWWQDHGPRTLAWVGAVVVVCAAVYFWRANEASADANAVVALANATQTEDFEAVAALDAEASPLARLDLAHGLYASGDYENALGVYEASLAELDDPAIRDIAAVGRVCALEALGPVDEAHPPPAEQHAPKANAPHEALAAAAELEAAFAKAAPTHYLTSELILAKARILCQQGDKAAAQEALKPLLGAPEGSPLAKYKPQAERTAQIIAAYEKKTLFDQAAEAAPAVPAAPAKEPAAKPAEAPAPAK